jgi:hypothetical protein
MEENPNEKADLGDVDSALRHLARRGLWQTAFSYAKALLSLDPEVRHLHVHRGELC